jgi:hypothetical protein
MPAIEGADGQLEIGVLGQLLDVVNENFPLVHGPVSSLHGRIAVGRPVAQHLFLDVLRIDVLERHQGRHVVDLVPVHRPETVEHHLRADRMLALVRRGEGIQRRAGRVPVDVDAVGRMAAGAEGVVHLVPVVDVGLVVDHHHHVEPGAELGAEGELADLLGDARVGRLHADDHHVVRRARMHVHAGDRDALALQQLLQLEAERERAQQLALVLRHAHVGDGHRRVVAVGDAIHAEGDAEVARAGAVAGVLAEGALLDLVVGADLALEDDLGVGRHLQVVGLALHQPRRLAGEHADQFRLGDRRGRAGGHRGQRRQADGGGEGTALAARQVVVVERLAEVGEGEHRADMVRESNIICRYMPQFTSPRTGCLVTTACQVPT